MMLDKHTSPIDSIRWKIFTQDNNYALSYHQFPTTKNYMSKPFMSIFALLVGWEIKALGLEFD